MHPWLAIRSGGQMGLTAGVPQGSGGRVMIRAVTAVAMTAAAALLVGPAAASAATRTVDLGLPVSAQSVPRAAQLRRQRVLPARDDGPCRRQRSLRADRLPHVRLPSIRWTAASA